MKMFIFTIGLKARWHIVPLMVLSHPGDELCNLREEISLHWVSDICINQFASLLHEIFGKILSPPQLQQKGSLRHTHVKKDCYLFVAIKSIHTACR